MKPRIGISRCLLGDEVRHDGRHKRAPMLLEHLGPHVEWVPTCPEVEIGMGTPREPIQLVADPAGVLAAGERVRLLGVESARDWTSEMVGWAARRVGELRALAISGYILKSKSPSCGLDSVDVVHAGSGTLSGRGLFAEQLVDAFPGLPIEEEHRLLQPHLCQHFLDRVRAYGG